MAFMGVTFTKAKAFPCRIETPFSSAEGHLFSPCKKELFEHPVNWSPVGMSSAAFWDSEIANYWDELHSWHTQKNDKHIVPNAARKYLKVTFSTIRFRCRNTLKWVWWVAVEVFLEGGSILIQHCKLNLPILGGRVGESGNFSLQSFGSG